MNLNKITLLAFFVFLTLGACNSSCKKNSPKLEHAALVNNTPISLSELDELHERSVTRMEQANRPVPDELSKKIRASILKKMIDDEVIQQKAIEEGVKVDRIERIEALEQYKTKLGGPKAFEVFLKRAELTEEQVLQTIVAEKQREKLIDKINGQIKVEESEILDHYKRNTKLYTSPEMVQARHILFKFSPNDPANKEELVLKKAQNVLKELNNKDANFAKIAEKYSECPSAPNGGDLGFFPRGRMVKPFEDAAFSAELNKILGPIKTDYGYHLLKVEQKTPVRPAPIEEVREKIKEFLTHNKRSKLAEQMLSSLRKKTNISIFDKSLALDEYRVELIAKPDPKK